MGLFLNLSGCLSRATEVFLIWVLRSDSWTWRCEILLDKSENAFWMVWYPLVKMMLSQIFRFDPFISDKLDMTTTVVCTALIYHIIYSWKCCNSSVLVPSYSLTAGMGPQATQITLYRSTLTFFALTTQIQHCFLLSSSSDLFSFSWHWNQFHYLAC